MGSRWTPAEDDAIIRGVLAKKTDAEIAAELPGRTEAQVSVRLHAIREKYPKLPNRKKGREYPERRKPKHVIPELPESLIPTVRSLMRTMTDQQLGEHLGYEAEAVRKFRRAHKLTKPKAGYKNLRWPMPNGTVSGHVPELLETYTDEQGRTIRRFSAGFAYGASPQRSVGGKE